MSYLEIADLGKSFQEKSILHELSLYIDEGDFVCFLGPSGCGKTTLLHCIAGLLQPSSGAITLGGENITFIPPEKRGCGVVFQNYALFPNLTAAENIGYGLRGKAWNKNNRQQRVDDLLHLVDLSDAKARFPDELSGGQQQRVALARALAPSPRLLLLDEPLSALDARIRLQLGNELRNLQRKIGITTIMVTHDQQEALSLANKIVVMNEGRIEQVGEPATIYAKPENRFVAAFVGEMNFCSFTSEKNIDFGIRYEDVGIQEATELYLQGDHTWTARIESIQHLGQFLRLDLLLQDYETHIHADMHVSTAQAYTCGDIVAVTLPLEKRVSWNVR